MKSIGIGSLLWVFLLVSCGSKGTPTPVVATGPLKVEQLEARKDGAHLLLRVTIQVTNATAEPMTVSSEIVSLLAGAEPIAPFIRPFAPHASIAAGEVKEAKLDYWLPQGRLGEPLQLKFQGQALTLKAAGEFNSSQLPEGQMVFLSWPNWQQR